MSPDDEFSIVTRRKAEEEIRDLRRQSVEENRGGGATKEPRLRRVERWVFDGSVTRKAGKYALEAETHYAVSSDILDKATGEVKGTAEEQLQLKQDIHVDTFEDIFCDPVIAKFFDWQRFSFSLAFM